jgi:hypothetical protein
VGQVDIQLHQPARTTPPEALEDEMTTFENPLLDDDEDDAPAKPWERDYTDEQRQEMKRRKGAGELLPGHKRRKTVYGRRDITGIDLHLMQHIGVHKACSSSVAAVLLGVTQRTASRRLAGLKELKVVNCHEIGKNLYWYLTPKGADLLEQESYAVADDMTTGRSDQFDLAAASHTLAVSMTAAHLVAGTTGDAIDAKQIIGETAIRRAWGRAAGNFEKKDLYGRGYAGEQLKRSVIQRIKAGSLAWPQVMNEAPALWTITTVKDANAPRGRQFHHPDFVVNFEAGRGRTPQSIAFEVELSAKKATDYEAILNTYKNDLFVYAKVVWVIRDENISKLITTAAEKVGLPSDRLGFDLLRGADGERLDGFAWRI